MHPQHTHLEELSECVPSALTSRSCLNANSAMNPEAISQMMKADMLDVAFLAKAAIKSPHATMTWPHTKSVKTRSPTLVLVKMVRSRAAPETLRELTNSMWPSLVGEDGRVQGGVHQMQAGRNRGDRLGELGRAEEWEDSWEKLCVLSFHLKTIVKHAYRKYCQQ